MITGRHIQLVESERLRHIAKASLDSESASDHMEVAFALSQAVKCMKQNQAKENGSDPRCRKSKSEISTVLSRPRLLVRNLAARVSTKFRMN